MMLSTLQKTWSFGSFAGLLFVGAACGPTAPTPVEPEAGAEAAPGAGGSPSDEGAACADQPAASAAWCECQGGYVKGDIGDGKVACTDGEVDLGRVQLGIEGSVCCKASGGAAAPAPAPEPSAGRTCGTRGAAPCAAGEFCDFPLSASCGETDAPGTCQPVPEMCTREYRPVCGCDGQTYSTRCTAASKGVAVKTEAACAN